ncbi:MAG: dihydroorotate dehydrogenase [Deltaproteobacteria bacterium]|nr:dihydroorotate dehydrogenase [Deltaproteobacteria bacterium]
MPKQPDLSIELFGCKLKNPTVLASGILGTTRDLLKTACQNGAGAVTIKSISEEPREGHANPTVLAFGPGLINAVGYSNPGIDNAAREFTDLQDVGGPVIGSLIGTCVEEFAHVSSRMDEMGFAALEVPLSCPHTPGYGKLGNQDNPEDVFQIVKTICSNTTKPLFVKLPPAASAGNLVEMALAAKDAGAYGITAANTIGPGMVIDIESGKPYLGFQIGGISGPALKPLAIATVYQLFEAVDLPIIGTGGVSSGRDAIEMIMAGATAVGIGTAVLSRGMSAFQDITDEMEKILVERGVTSLSEIRGLAHK